MSRPFAAWAFTSTEMQHPAREMAHPGLEICGPRPEHPALLAEGSDPLTESEDPAPARRERAPALGECVGHVAGRRPHTSGRLVECHRDGFFAAVRFAVEWDWGARNLAVHVSPVPSIHSVRWVFPNTVGSAVLYRRPFGPKTFDHRSAFSRPPA